MAAQILRDLGITKVCLLTNNPKKIDGLKRYGVDVVERSPIEIPAHKGNLRYLQTKKLKLGHLFTGLEPND
jgi:3,4-dihydroxy 2-butanone 4-phosphate synthase/GTP cyclohydrolase II